MDVLLFLMIFSAIFILFGEEVTGFIKKLYAKYWVRFIVPLIGASWLWVWHDEFIPLFLKWLQTDVLVFSQHLIRIFPHGIRWLVFVFGLFIFASFPAWLIYWITKRKSTEDVAKKIATRVYLFSWVFFAILMLYSGV